MSKDQSEPQTRSIEVETEINAPVDAVWKALTDAEELTRWFPLEARVNPGEGGSVWASYGEGVEGEAPIDVWEENKHLRIVFGGPHAPHVATDYYLESRGNKTVLRLVHSGFGADSDWDDLFEATRRGWHFQMRGLRHYLERHSGTARSVVQFKIPIGQLTLDAAWQRLMGPDGFAREGQLSGLSVGERFQVRTAGGDELQGIVELLDPPADFAGVIENLNDALLRLWLDPPLTPFAAQNTVYIWLSTYGLSKAKIESIRAAWKRMLGDLFPTT